MRVFGAVRIDAPDDWTELVDETPEPGVGPTTLTRNRAHGGAFQLSVARYVTGPRPSADDRTLAEILVEWGGERGLVLTRPTITGVGDRLVAEASYVGDEFAGAAWAIFHQGSFVFATYFAGRDFERGAEELAACRAMVRSMEVSEHVPPALEG